MLGHKFEVQSDIAKICSADAHGRRWQLSVALSFHSLKHATRGEQESGRNWLEEPRSTVMCAYIRDRTAAQPSAQLHQI